MTHLHKALSCFPSYSQSFAKIFEKNPSHPRNVVYCNYPPQSDKMCHLFRMSSFYFYINMN